MPFGPKWTAGISGHYSEAWAIALRIGAEDAEANQELVEASGSHGSCQEAGGRQGRGRKGCGRVGRGPEEVRKAMGKFGRGGKAREVMVHYTLHLSTMCVSMGTLRGSVRATTVGQGAERNAECVR